MRLCQVCQGPVHRPGEDGRGVSQRKCCRVCWIAILKDVWVERSLPQRKRRTLHDIAEQYGVSVAAISQKISYVKEQEQRS